MNFSCALHEASSPLQRARKTLKNQCVAGWRRGYAADCKSAPQIPASACFASEIREIPNLKNSRTNPKHNGNVSNRLEDVMKITPYNQEQVIEMLRARAFLLLMSDDVVSIEGEFSAPLWDLVGDMSMNDALDAIRTFEATQ